MSEDINYKYKNVFNYEADRQKKYRAVIIFILCLLIFSITALGFTDWLSSLTSSFLEKNLGFTNKWTKYYGPDWFVHLNSDISALGGFPLLCIFLLITLTYYKLRKESRRMWRLFFVVTGGGLLTLGAKSIFGEGLPDDLLGILFNSIAPFPSGHTAMGTIFYAALSVTIARRQHSDKSKRLTLISAIVIIALIGISRILPGHHTVSDVIAGWSLGVMWLCFCWVLERYIKKYRHEKSLRVEQNVQ